MATKTKPEIIEPKGEAETSELVELEGCRVEGLTLDIWKDADSTFVPVLKKDMSMAERTASVREVTKQDHGATFASLTRVSHIHLFGISFIFMFVGLIFSFSETPTTKYKCIAIGMPYIFLAVDILSWWLTKLNPHFAWLVIIGGGAMAISFGFMWIVSIYEMWIMPRLHSDSRDALLDE